MTPNEDHHDAIDRAELDATAYALGEFAGGDAEAVEAKLSADARAKRACAETKVIAGDLREAYETTELPAASPELRALLEEQLTTSPSEDLVVTKAPDILAPARRRRFTPLEILLSIAVMCFAGLFFLMSTRGQVQTALVDTSESLTNLDQSYSSGPDDYSSIVQVDDSESMSRASTPRCVTICRSKNGQEGADAVSLAKIDDKDVAIDELLGLDGEPKPSEQPKWTTEYYRAGSRNGQHFPIAMPTPAQIAEMQRRYNESKGIVASRGPTWRRPTLRVTGTPDPAMTVGLDPASARVSDLEVDFFESDFDGAAPAVGGFDATVGGDQHARIYENEFKSVEYDPLSTFSIDVDTASYSKLRQHILQHGQLPPPDAIRIEELINYFPYDYNEPMDEHPFAAHMEVAQCPWQAEHRLARIAIKGKEMKPDARPASNLVFLIDVSGSMNEANKLPLVIRGLEMLTRELNKNDRVAIVVYAGAAGLVLPSTTGDEQDTILAALKKLEAGGSTAGAEGINLAYKTAEEHFITAGVNRVILCTDGDFNVGVSDTGSLVRLAEEQAKKNIFLSILGFGIGNLNDEMLEQVSDKANGMYAFIDTENEARKVLVEQMSGTLVTIAKDVKIQIEFNPTKVAAYRLIGYENRILAAEDFNNDKKDAGEIGAGHTVTALYEIVPVIAKEKPEIPAVDALKYQRPSELTDAAESDELLTLKLRYKSPEGEKSTLLSEPVDDSTEPFGKVSDDFKFAAAVASFGMLLRGSEYSGDATLDAVLEIATDGAKHDEWGYRKEFLEIVKRAKELKR